MDEPSIDACFRLLKLPRGVDLARVKQAYRKNLYKCHPDRFQNRPDLLPAAERKTKLLVQVYGVLERWYDANGGMDPATGGRDPAREGPGVEPDLDDEPGDAAPGIARWAKIVVAVAAVASFGIFLRGFFGAAPGATPAVAPQAPPTEDAAPRDATAPVEPRGRDPRPAPPPSDDRRALEAARDQAREAWLRTYDVAWERELAASRSEVAQAQEQYGRDVQAVAAPIADAERERDRLMALARLDSDRRRDAFIRQAADAEAATRRAYDQWLLRKGGEAVALIQRIREREHSKVGVFSTTEDPARIFEFWTAEEAGAPEINIAAKSGITVRQPDSRYFPHFRTNINLYEPEGGVLVRMMEEIVEEHDTLYQKMAEQRVATDAEVRDWEGRHPVAPLALDGRLASVLDARDRAVGRLDQARARLDTAVRALTPSAAAAAFEQSAPGRDFAARLARPDAAARAKGKAPGASGAAP